VLVVVWVVRPRLKLERKVDLEELNTLIERALKAGDRVWLRRLEGLRLFAAGLRIEDVARHLGVQVRTVRDWVNLWNKGGFGALKPGKSPGRPYKLSEEEWKKLERDLEKSPREFGYDCDLWSTRLVMIHISTNYGVRYEYKYMYRLLRKGGFLVS
jgi:transposase